MRALGVPPAEGWGSAGRKPSYGTYLGFRLVRRECVPGVATGRTLPATALAAGEIAFRRAPGGWEVVEVSNQSTGYCPDPDCWPAVAGALDRAGVGGPDGFTHALVFRRCERCRENNVVREGEFVCVFCGGELPLGWNVRPQDPAGS